MASTLLSAVAEDLIAASLKGLTLSPPSHAGEFTFSDAYGVAALLHEHRIAAGGLPVGVKLGFTNRAVWDELGLDAPFWAHMYRDSVSQTASVPTVGLVQPRVEPEIVLGLKSELRAGATRSQVAEAVAWAAIGIEIVHCHYPGWVMTPPDALADGGLHAGLRYGHTVAMTPDGLDELAAVRVELECDGEPVATGMGANALGGPLEALYWLLTLDQAPDLPAGTVITTGTLTVAPPAKPGQRWTVRASIPFEEEFAVAVN